MEQQWNDTDGKSNDSERNASQCHFVHQKFHMDGHGQELGSLSEKPAINHMSYGMAQFQG
jgi:hypothetical protein